MVVEQVTSIICNSILFGTCKIFVWLEGEMYCMLSASLCLNCTAVKRDNKSEERGAVWREGPRSGCTVYWWKCTVLCRPCKGLGIQERDFSICTEKSLCWCNGAVHTCSVLVEWRAVLPGAAHRAPRA